MSRADGTRCPLHHLPGTRCTCDHHCTGCTNVYGPLEADCCSCCRPAKKGTPK